MLFFSAVIRPHGRTGLGGGDWNPGIILVHFYSQDSYKVRRNDSEEFQFFAASDQVDDHSLAQR